MGTAEQLRTEAFQGPHSSVCEARRVVSCLCLHLPLAVLESVSQASLLPLSLPTAGHTDPSLRPRLSRVPWLWLRAGARRLSPWGVGACECSKACRCAACGSAALSGRSCAWRGGLGARGWASEGKAGLRRSGRPRAPWLPSCLGTGQVPRRMGAQGPGCCAPARRRPRAHWLRGDGGWFGGPPEAGGGVAGSQTPPGSRGDQDGGRLLKSFFSSSH